MSRQTMVEFTVRGIGLAICLTVVLAMSNAYLALKLGILTSASIPAAIISMGILRLCKNSSILENNLVQTAASAGEAVAGGIVYTIPALVVIGYWHQFDYWTNFFIALTGGVLGVMFSVPLRRILVHDNSLKFPEGRAIAEVLKSSSERAGMKDIVLGGAIGMLLELFQVGFKVIANQWHHWFVTHRTIFGFGGGFSTTMFAAGYLIGYDMAVSIFIGALIAWGIALPVASHVFPIFLSLYDTEKAVAFIWDQKLRYIGIGAMLFSGVWTLLHLIRPLVRSIKTSFRTQQRNISLNVPTNPRERDIPFPVIVLVTFVATAGLYVLFSKTFPLTGIQFSGVLSTYVLSGSVLYVLIFGILFSVTTAYFSGMVGVTASPGSSVVIAGILFAASILLAVMNGVLPLPLTDEQIMAAEAIVIIIGSVVTGIAAIANDNTQDLKVGHLVGATPWKQQVMLLLGVLVSSLVIPPVMQILFNVYGIAGVVPRESMDVAQSLPAPTAALLAAIAKAVFNHDLPWKMMMTGAAIIVATLVINHVFRLYKVIRLSILGIAVGMYLPIETSSPLFLGGLLSLFVNKQLNKKGWIGVEADHRNQVGTLIACGLVAGAALLDVVLAIPFSMLHSPDALRLVGQDWAIYGIYLGIATLSMLAAWLYRRVCR